MERICSHGVGHPDPDDIAFKFENGLDDAMGVHGCDGCCSATSSNQGPHVSIITQPYVV
jgi:hypothetical protein